MKNEILSPLTGNSNVSHIETLNTGTIIERYRSELNIDVSWLSKGISIYQCRESGLKFYHPLSMAGDEKFYEELAKKEKNYYSEWKWEYSAVLPTLFSGTSALEIGCGNGYFLKQLADKNINSTGLEFNNFAIDNARKQGLKVKKESIQKHVLTNSSSYDYVCAFQVFEHTPDIREIISASIEALKPGGLLIIGVPNNDSYIFSHDKYHTLNLPPHHILLWDQYALKQLPQIFHDIKLSKLMFEPETKTFRSMCYKLYLKNKMGKSFFSSLLFRSTRFLVKQNFKNKIKFGDGPTVLAIYEKK